MATTQKAVRRNEEDLIGWPLKRMEDGFVTGLGKYLDDPRLPRVLHPVYVRNPYAHAGMVMVEPWAAFSHPDVARPPSQRTHRRVKDIPAVATNSEPKGTVGEMVTTDLVRHAGEVVATLLAEDRYTGEGTLSQFDATLQRKMPAARPDCVRGLNISAAAHHSERGVRGRP